MQYINPLTIITLIIKMRIIPATAASKICAKPITIIRGFLPPAAIQLIVGIVSTN